MKVTLRKRNQGGKTSLYLDYYHKGKRKTEYLKLYLSPNAKTKEEKEIDLALSNIRLFNGVFE